MNLANFNFNLHNLLKRIYGESWRNKCDIRVRSYTPYIYQYRLNPSTVVVYLPINTVHV